MGKRTGMPRGRPSKMKIWIDALKKVLAERKIIFLTDEDLVLLVNREIKASETPNFTIDTRTFKRWKSGDTKNDTYGEEFLETLQLAYIDMKDYVGEKLQTDSNFARWAWILERKFAGEFSLIKRFETTHKNETIIQITAGDKENQQLLDGIINGNAIDIEFKEVEPTLIQSGKTTDNIKNDEFDF